MGRRVGRAPPWRQRRTDRKGQVSQVDKRRQALGVAKTRVCEGAVGEERAGVRHRRFHCLGTEK